MAKLAAIQDEKAGVVLASTSVLASVVAASACVGPMLGIALGVTGLGWLAGFAFLSIPAGIVSLVLLAAAIFLFARRKTSCASRRAHRLSKYFLIAAAVLVVGLNAFEFLVLPNLM